MALTYDQLQEQYREACSSNPANWIHPKATPRDWAEWRLWLKSNGGYLVKFMHYAENAAMMSSPRKRPDGSWEPRAGEGWMLIPMISLDKFISHVAARGLNPTPPPMDAAVLRELADLNRRMGIREGQKKAPIPSAGEMERESEEDYAVLLGA